MTSQKRSAKIFRFNAKKIFRIATICCLFALVFSIFPKVEPVVAAFNEQINYQGKLSATSGVPVANGLYNIRFKLYTDAAGTQNVWTEECTTTNRIQTTNGLFSHLLGSVNTLPDDIFNQTLYLGVEIGGSDGTPSWDGEMRPLKKIGAVAAAFEAKRLSGKTEAQFATLAENETVTGQWTIGNILTVSTSSNSAALTINQTGSGAAANLTGSMTVNTSTVSAVFTLQGTSTNALANIMTTAASPVLYITNDGKVGIGTTTPSYALAVAGDANITGTYRINGADYGQFFIDSVGTAGQLWKSDGSGRGAWITTSTLGIALGDITGTNVLAYLANNQTFTGENTFSATTTLATTTVTKLTATGQATFGNVSSTNLTITGNSYLGTIISGAGTITNVSSTGITVTNLYPTNIIGATNVSTTNITASGNSYLNTTNITGQTTFTTASGTALTLSGNEWVEGALSVTGQTTAGNVSSTNLTVSGNSYVGTVKSGTWNGSAIDISSYTNLTAGSGIVLTDDALSHSTANGYLHIPSNGASTQLLQYSSAGTAKWITMSGDASIADNGSVTVADDSHAHTGATISGSLTLTGVSSTYATATNALFGNVSSTNLTVSGNSYVGTVKSGTWNGAVVGPTYLGSGTPSANTLLFGDGSWKATSTLGLTLSDISGTNVLAYLANNQTFTGQNTFSATSTLATSTISRLTLTGGFLDSTNNIGTLGMVLQSTGTSTRWVATSTLGLGGSGSTPAAGSTGQLQFNNANAFAATTVLAWDNTNGKLSIGTSTARYGQLFVGDKTPIKIASTTIGTTITDLRIKDNFLFVMPNGYIYDISNPSNPVYVNSLGSGNNIFIQGDLAVVSNDNSFSLYDISDPANPVMTDSEGVWPSGAATKSTISGKYLYSVNASYSNLAVYDISDPYNIISINSNSDVPFSTPRQIVAQGNRLYVADINLHVFDITTPSNPIELTGYNFGLGGIVGLRVQGQYAYVLRSNLSVVNIATSTPFLAGSIAVSNAASEGLEVAGRYAYVNEYGLFSIYDISNPASIFKTGSMSLSAGLATAIQGRYAYVGDGIDVKVIDLGGIFTSQLETGALLTGSLGVSGNTQLGGALSIGGSLVVGAGGIFSQGPLGIMSSSTAPTTTIFSVDSNGANNILTVNAAGGVGIGTSSPLTLFQVAGTATMQNILPDMTGGSGNVSLYDLGNATNRWNSIWASSVYVGSSTWQISQQSNGRLAILSSVAGTERFTITNTGNVGVGTTSPSHLFTVAGNTNVTGNITVGGTINTTGQTTYGNASGTALTLSGNQWIGGALSVTGQTTLGNASTSALTNSGFSYLQGMSFTNASGSALTLSGNEWVGGTLSVTGKTTLGNVSSSAHTVSGNEWVGGALAVTGQTTLGNASSTNLTVSTNSYFNVLNITGQTTFTTASGTALTLSGNEWVGGTLSVTGKATLGNVSSSAHTISGNEWVGGALSVTGQTTVANASGSALTLSGNQWVGGALSVTGQATAGNVSSTNLTISTNSYLGTVKSGTWNGGIIGLAYGGTATSTTPTQDQLLIGNGSGYDLKKLTAGTNITITTSSGNITITATGGSGTPAGSDMQIQINNAGAFGADSLFVFNTTTNRLGVGTSTPGYMLDVAGDINTTGTLRISGTDYGQFFIDSAGTIGQLWQSDGSGRGGWVNTSSLGIVGGSASPGGADHQVQFNNAGSFGGAALVYWDHTNNRLGVGTSTPTSTLEVYSSTTNAKLSISAQNAAGGSYSPVLDFNIGNKPLTYFRILMDNSDGFGKILSPLAAGGHESININTATGYVGIGGDPEVTNSFDFTVNGDTYMTGNLAVVGKVATLGGFNGACVTGGVWDRGGMPPGMPPAAIWDGNCNQDVAEIYNSNEDILPGEVVSLDDEEFTVRRSTSTYENNIIGVVSARPGIILGLNGSDVLMGGESNTYSWTSSSIARPAVALMGKVPVKVSNENGPIYKGDYLTSASQPGFAMKATRAGKVIGTAITDFDVPTTTPSTSYVMVFMGVQYLGNDLFAQENGNGQIENGELDQLKNNLSSLGIIIHDDGTIEVNKLKANRVITNGFEMNDRATGQTYCVWIQNGDWRRELGNCDEVEQRISAPESNPEQSSSSTLDTPSSSTSAGESSNPSSISPPAIGDINSPVQGSNINPIPSSTDSSINSPTPAVSESPPVQITIPAPDTPTDTGEESSGEIAPPATESAPAPDSSPSSDSSSNSSSEGSTAAPSESTN